MSPYKGEVLMTGRSIVVDDEVFAELQSLAEPLIDDANSVLRRVLNLVPNGAIADLRPDAAVSSLQPSPDEVEPITSSPVASRARAQRTAPKRKKKSDRAPKGSLLPEAEYELPLLEALVELGGSAPTSDVVDLLGKKLEAKLTDVDRETISSGEIRWRNRVQFVRLGLIKEGLMVKESPRGVWEITDEGRARIAKAEATS
jgi:hypothetical protein